MIISRRIFIKVLLFMNISKQFNKFDRKYLFLEYHLTHCLPIQRKTNQNLTKQNEIQVRSQTVSLDLTDLECKIQNKNIDLKTLSLYLQFVESTIAKDFILIHHIWSFFKIYSKPKLFKLFPNRRSFLCYWIFPFVGFITISNFNNGINKPLILMDSSTHPFLKKDFVRNNSPVHWDNFEYLNYKKLFLHNNTLNNKINKSLIQTSNTKLTSGYNTTDMFLLNSSNNKNFDQNKINNIITHCNFYLTQTAESIYTNTVTNKFGYDTFKVNNFSETLLGNQFNSTTILEYYWYSLNAQNMNKTQTNSFYKKISNFDFQNNSNSASNSNISKNWQIHQEFPDKLLTDLNYLDSINKIRDIDKEKFLILACDDKHIFTFGEIINVKFKETELIPNVVKQFKKKLRLYQESHPILFYQKAYSLLTKLIEKFEIDFSLDLKTSNLKDNIYSQELNYNLSNNKNLESRFLNYLNKLLLTSKFLEKPSDSISSKKFTNFIQTSSTLGSLTQTKTKNIELQHQEKLQFNYYLLTKKNLHSILLKKLFLNSRQIKSLKHLEYSSAERIPTLIPIYNIQKKFIKQKQFRNTDIVIEKSNVFNLVNNSKAQFKKQFLVAKLNCKMNKQLEVILDQSLQNLKQSLNLRHFIIGADQTAVQANESYSSSLVIPKKKPFSSYNQKTNLLSFNEKQNKFLIRLLSTLPTSSSTPDVYLSKVQNQKQNNLSLSENLKSLKNLHPGKIVKSMDDFIYFSEDPFLLQKRLWLKKINKQPMQASIGNWTNDLTKNNLNFVNFEILNDKLLYSLLDLKYNNKKMKVLVNNLNINNKLTQNKKLEEIRKYNNYKFYNPNNRTNRIIFNSLFYSSALKSKQKKFKTNILWSKLKINNFNSLVNKKFNNKPKANLPVKQNEQTISINSNNGLYCEKFLIKNKPIGETQRNQLYYINGVNKTTSKIKPEHFYSNNTLASKQPKFRKLIASTDITLENQKNLFDLKFINFPKQLNNVKTVQITQQFSSYIHNLANQLKHTLINSKLYIIKISKTKKLNFKNSVTRNFYINLTKNKTLSFKVNKVKYKMNKNNLTNFKILNSKRSQIQLKQPIEKIFRNYLSSKYNKQSNSSLQSEKPSFDKNKSSFLRLRESENLSFFQKESNFSAFRIYNKHFNLKFKKAFSTKNYKKIEPETINYNSSRTYFIPKQCDKQMTESNLNMNYRNTSLQSPYHLIKKIGFLFLKSELQGVSDSLLLKKLPSLVGKYDPIYFQELNGNVEDSLSGYNKTLKNEQQNYAINLDDYKKNYFKKTRKKQSLLKRLEKGKNLQKKRRQKKQARLTGRRKKRKRFFPRPIWLRVVLYKKFLKFRHSYKLKLIPVKLERKNLTLHANLSSLLKFMGKKHQIKLPLLNKMKPNSLSKAPVYSMERENQKVRQTSLRQRIYRSNKQNWGNIFFDIPKLEKMSLKKFFLIESLPIFSKIHFYDISKNVLDDFKKTMWKSYWLRTNFPTYIKNIQNNLDQIKNSITESYVLLNLKQFLFEIFGLNFYENSLKFFSLNLNFNNNLSLLKKDKEQIQSLDFVNYKNKIEISKNLKLPKNKRRSASKFIQNRSLNYSPLWYLNIRQNFSNLSTIPNGYIYLETSNLEQFNSSLYNRIQSIIKNMKNNLNVDGNSQLRGFNPKRSSRTMLSSNNFLENLLKEWWTRFENSLNYSVSLINIPQEIYVNQAKFRILWSLNKTNVWSFKKLSDNSFTWNRSKIRDQNKSNKTNKSIQHFFNKIKYSTKNKSTRRQKLIHKIFLEKFQNTNEKIKQLGLLITDKDSLAIKVNLFSSTNKTKMNAESRSLTKNSQLKNQVSNLLVKENLTSYFKRNPKHYLQFWWSESKLNNYFVVQTDFSFKNDFFLPVLGNANQINPTTMNRSFFLKGNSKADFVSISTCLILLHLCLLFTLLNIGQIRTFLKFQILCIYKLTNIYLTIIYSTFKNLKQLKTTLYLYSNITSNLFKNLMITKKSFLLLRAKDSYKEADFYEHPATLKLLKKNDLSPQNNLTLSLRFSSNKTPNLILYSNHQYRLYQDFQNSIFKSLRFTPPPIAKYDPMFYEPNLNFGIQTNPYNFTEKDYFHLYSLFQSENSHNQVELTNEFRMLIKQSPIYQQVLERISNIKDKSEFLRLVILKNTQKLSQKTFILQKIKPVKYNTMLRKNNFSNISGYNLFDSTNLFCYNIIKSSLGFKATLSLIPSRAVKKLSSPKNLKQLPKQYQSFASLILNKYIINSFYLSILFFVAILIKISNKSVIGLYIIFFKLIDLVEGVMLIIYKSLEKPAELMIDFISEFFLIEWSSDIVSFIPETLDIYTSAFSQKLSRNFRIFGFTSFFAQRRFLCFMESFLDGITRPDIDLIIRQKKGIIFWDIWAEILVHAAEIYSINLSSLFNIKEEQDLFLERLINEKKWNWSNEVLDKMSPLMQLLQNTKPSGFSHNSSLFCNSEQIWRRWSVNPYYTYQAKDTDLFVENHPPKSFSHFKLMKYYPPVFEPVGNLVCQIYAGQFVKSISKNLLLVGARGTNKTLLIQALAGETELKLMIDNAKRYALTSKGMAIGMKLLKDVFDALALQAPCLFIIEDIHIIGERRPMLISDDENIKAMENSFGVDQEEIHEKNQVIYQLSRHAIVHYKKPYKGDFSLLIPTNHFALDLFLGSTPPTTRFIAQVPENPLPVQSIEQEISYQNESNDKSSLTYKKFFSQLQLPKKEIFSPPSTSPFTILLLKEQKKIKPKKIVSEMPWGGLSADQLIQLPKASYSVRVKVALLADIAIRNLSVKLDRITDLLIIIDSVRSHRGFVVIGTTHIPSILDPALRRPGRFDETLTIPALPNLWSRWEILKASVSDFTSTLDLMDLAELFNTLNDTELSTIIGKTKLFLVTKQSFLTKNVNTELENQLVQSIKIKTLLSSNPFQFSGSEKVQNPQGNLLNSFDNGLKVGTYPIIIEPFQMKQNKKYQSTVSKNKNLIDLIVDTTLINSNFNQKMNSSSVSALSGSLQAYKNENSLVSNLNSFNGALSIFKTSTNCLSISYCQISKWFINSQLIKDRSSYTSLLWSTISKNSLNGSASLFSTDSFNAMLSYPENNSTFGVYNSTHELKNELVQLFAGKIGEFFIFYDIKSMTQLLQKNHNTLNLNLNNLGYDTSSLSSTKNYHSFWNDFQSINTWKYSNIVNLYGIDETWQRTSDLIFSIIYKRCLYNKNILIHRLFNLHNIKSLRQPPSPPVSTSFTAAKRYENYKRIEFDLQNRLTFSIHEKIQKHQQQRYIKTLYNKPIQKYFRSELETYTKNGKSSNSRLTTFENSFREMSLIDINQKLQSQNKSSRLSSTSYLFNNRINIRHRFYLINQWWNTQLAEHNAETTFLSEIDWRYMFMEGIGDLWMDFPDTDQHYNPRTRQWMLTSGYWSYWYNFEKVITQEIYYQFLMESFYKAYNVLEKSRELLDVTCYDFLTSAVLKEIDFINYLKRFYK